MKYLKSMGIFIIGVLLIVTLFSTFSYFDILSVKTSMIATFIFTLLIELISGYYIGLNSKNKGYLEGCKIAAINTCFLLIFTLLFKKFTFKSIIYYLLLIIVAIFGSIYGINKKGKQN